MNKLPISSRFEFLPVYQKSTPRQFPPFHHLINLKLPPTPPLPISPLSSDISFRGLLFRELNKLVNLVLPLNPDTKPLIQLLPATSLPIKFPRPDIPLQNLPIDPQSTNRACMPSQIREQRTADAPRPKRGQNE